ncbi:AEC family transporter [Niveispirillum fermenti]|uniref:AEC family transporter n=1 Tax=Niveispirillum fermenti TaxID=1233113 RepID=UPI003A87841A
METIVNVILPVFGLVAIGFITGRPPLFQADFARSLSNFIFYLALPCLLFRSMAARGLPHGDELNLMAAYYLALTVLMLGSFLYARQVHRESLAGAATLMLGASFSNTVLVGVPLILAAYGQAGLQQMLLLVTCHSAYLLGGATVLAEASRAAQGGAGFLRITMQTAGALARNPVIVSILAGLAFGSVGGTIPVPLDNIIRMLGDAAVPCSLFALGASLVGLEARGLLGRTSMMVVAKLLVLPALVFVSGRYIFDLPPLTLAVAVTTASLPSGMNVFLFAQRYQTLVSPVASATLLTTLLSALVTGLIIEYFRAATVVPLLHG